MKTRINNSFHHTLVPSEFGTAGIVWQKTSRGPTVVRIFLPDNSIKIKKKIQSTFPAASPRTCRDITKLKTLLQRYFEGKEVTFDLDTISLAGYSPFQQKVLLAGSKIPWGWMSTYGRIGKQIGSPQGARAVGGALSQNRFPVVIPCHRIIRSDGALGGFQGGGLKMKKTLLKLEGIPVTSLDRVTINKMYY
jgi:methylated-DNA-[protein]-cysteine S-methyltransferase